MNVSRFSLAALALCVAGACSDPEGPLPGVGPNRVRIQSDAGDPVGIGRSYDYTQANAVLTVDGSGRTLYLSVVGDERWNIYLLPPGTGQRLVPGEYVVPGTLPYDPAMPRMSVQHFNGVLGCDLVSGRFTIVSVEYDEADGRLAAVDATLEQQCSGAPGALRATIHWRRGDPTTPPGPAAIPSSLWRPAAGATPPTRNYIYLVSDAGDYVGQGGTWTYTQFDPSISTLVFGNALLFGNFGEWLGRFDMPSSVSRPEVGYYTSLQDWPLYNPTRGSVEWGVYGRTCGKTTGWLAIDAIGYGTSGALATLDLRFEQRCEGSTGAVHGAVHVGK